MANKLFPGMTDKEIQELIASSRPSEQYREEFREIIKAQETPEGKKSNEALRKKYPVKSTL